MSNYADDELSRILSTVSLQQRFKAVEDSPELRAVLTDYLISALHQSQRYGRQAHAAATFWLKVSVALFCAGCAMLIMLLSC